MFGDISLRWRLMPEAKLQKNLIAEGSVTAEGALVIYFILVFVCKVLMN
ncbi:MAG: hypothetical protein WA113_05480 [Desulfitobacteriaceae bacterium]